MADKVYPPVTFEEFQPTSYEVWKEEAVTSLKGGDFQKKLFTKTYEGITLQPIYTKADMEYIQETSTFPGREDYLRGAAAAGYIADRWDMAQSVEGATPTQANADILHELKKGATAVNLTIGRKGVVLLAATNRPESLDPALTRPGRFDRRIIVDRPNLAGRYQTLRVHTKNIKLAEDVDLHKIAQATAGAVGADLANLVNEAALRAVRMGRKAVNQQDLLTSFELVIAGTEKKGTVLTDTEKRIVSYHEVGHALVAALQKHSQPVSKITIVPHTSGALGYTMQMPEEEKFLSSKEELIVELQTMLGGRAAEQVVFGIATTGASNDIERATELARKMVTQYGMSDKLGLMALSTVSNPYLDGSTMMNCADSTSSAADEEIHKLLMDCYADAKKLLVEHRSLLDEIAMYLLSKETITGDEFMAYVNADSKRLTDGSEAEEPPEQTEAPSESE